LMHTAQISNRTPAIQLPLVVEEQVTGILGLWGDGLQEDDISPLSVFANQVAIAIENARLFDAEAKRRREAEILRKTLEELTSDLDRDQVLQSILLNLEEVVPHDSASLFILRGDFLHILANRGYTESDQIAGETYPIKQDMLFQEIQKTGKPLLIDDTHEEPGFKFWGNRTTIRSWMGIPLIVRNDVIGCLTIDSFKPYSFTETEAALAQAFANNAAVALYNAQLFSDVHRRVDELEALRATMTDITAELELSRVLKAVLQRAVMLLNATGGDLGLYDETEKRITIVSSYNLGKDYTGTIMLPGEGAMGQVINTGKPVYIKNYRKWDGRSPQYTEGPWYGVFASPLMITDQLVGVIGIVSDDPNRQFSETDSNLLNLFAQQAAIAVKNARLFEQTQSALAETKVLYQAARSMIALEDLPDLLKTVVDNLAIAIPADRILLVTLDIKNEEIIHLATGGSGADKIHLNSFKELWEGLSGWVIRERKSALSLKNKPDHREKPRIQKIRQETDGGSIIVIPLQYRNNILGTLTAINRLDQPNFTQRDVDLMVTVGNQTAIAIANAQLFEEVQKLAITDDLAGTYNRRHLFELGNIEFRRASRFGRALSVIMLDLDHFKVINDTHGHAIGDRVLNAVAQRCLKHIREIDILGRYGGEEFIILLPETNAKAAFSLADRLRKRVAENAVSTKVGPIYITISLGVAMLCDDDPDLETLFDHADSALYAAKEAGRNCVAYYKPKE
jgi:diguanylate cyclase (GGDEF)-like protein